MQAPGGSAASRKIDRLIFILQNIAIITEQMHRSYETLKHLQWNNKSLE